MKTQQPPRSSGELNGRGLLLTGLVAFVGRLAGDLISKLIH